ncbi:DUF4040 domain-containing protein [Mycoplasmatota bacterium zrk1]
MINILSIVISVLLVILAFLAVSSKKLSKSIVYLSALSMLSVLGFVVMKAPDVAVTEAVIGSGLVTALFVFTLLSSRKVVK